MVQPGGRLFLLTFTEEAPEGGVSRQQLYEVFADGWDVESVELVRGEVSPAFTAEFPDAFPEGGPKGWFAIIRRKRVNRQTALNRGVGSLSYPSSSASFVALPIGRNRRSHAMASPR